METDVCPPQILMKEESSKSISVVEEDIVALWRTVGTSQGLTTDIDICKYLLSLYIHRDEGGGRQNSRCSQCSAVLELVCLNCQQLKRLEQNESPLPVPQTLWKAPSVHHSKQQTPLIQENQSAQPFSTSEDNKLFFSEDSPELPQPVNDDDSDGGLDMEVFSPDAGDDSDIEMDPTGEKQSKNEDAGKPSKGKRSSKLSRKGKQSRVTLTAKRKTNQRSPESKKAKAAVDSTSSTTVSRKKGQEMGVICTVCKSVFQAERGLASHMRRSSCRLSLLQPSADGSETKAATEQLQQENASHPEIAASNSEGKNGESKGEENQVVGVPPGETLSPARARKKKARQADHSHQSSKTNSNAYSLAPHTRHTHGKDGSSHDGVHYQCDEPGCSKTFSHASFLKFHMNVVHSLVKPHQCGRCKKTFTSDQNLKCHICPVKTPICQVCSKEFKSMKLLRQHAHSHDEVPRFKCGTCSTTFKFQTNLQRHMKSPCPSKYRKQQSDDSTPLDRKQQSDDSTPLDRKQQSDDSTPLDQGKSGSSRYSARYRCDEPGCSKTFSHACNLTSHKNVVHLLVKPYQCERCKKTYACKTTLKRHVCVVQTAKKTYICHVCSKEFRTIVLLKQHAHSHDEVPTFMCHLCSARFKHLPNLKRHMKSRCSSKLNKKQCEFCRRTYADDQNHTCKPEDLRPPHQAYLCVICLKEFKTLSSLKTHALSHDEVPRYECETCLGRFRYLSNLRKHKKLRCPGRLESTTMPEATDEIVISCEGTDEIQMSSLATDEIQMSSLATDEIQMSSLATDEIQMSGKVKDEI